MHRGAVLNSQMEIISPLSFLISLVTLKFWDPKNPSLWA